MSEKLTRRALNAAWGALRELSPCMAPECQQVQTETLANAIKLVDEALGLAPAAFASFPATDASQAPSEAVASELCTYCGKAYPVPVGYHHDIAECEANIASPSAGTPEEK